MYMWKKGFAGGRKAEMETTGPRFSLEGIRCSSPCQGVCGPSRAWGLGFGCRRSSSEQFLLLFSCSVMSNSFRHHGLQHTRLPCPSPSTIVCSNSCPLNWWCHPTISSSVIPFSSCLQSFPASGSFPICQLFASGDQSTGAAASASGLPVNIQGWFPLGLAGCFQQFLLIN